jgi:hypothetical protein
VFPDGEKDTANQLAALIDRKGLFRLGQELAVARCRTRQELVATLQVVLARTVQGAMPMLHFLWPKLTPNRHPESKMG